MSVLINLSFPSLSLNNSLQVGDNVYYTFKNDFDPTGGFSSTDNPNWLGTVWSVVIPELPSEGNPVRYNVNTNIIVLCPHKTLGNIKVFLNELRDGFAYYSFSKSGIVNQNELIGYYASVKFENNSTEKAELFSAGTEVHENSK